MRILLTILREKKRNTLKHSLETSIGRMWKRISRTPYENNYHYINERYQPYRYRLNRNRREREVAESAGNSKNPNEQEVCDVGKWQRQNRTHIRNKRSNKANEHGKRYREQDQNIGRKRD